MVFDVGSISRMRSSRLSDSTTSLCSGIWPPTRPVLPPCGTIGVPVSLASLAIADTSATVVGRNTTGVWPWNMLRCSIRYGACMSGSVMANLSPTIAAKRASRAGSIFDLSSIGHIRWNGLSPENGSRPGAAQAALPRRGGAPEAVVDGFTEAVVRDRHHRDHFGPGAVERTQTREKIG